MARLFTAHWAVERLLPTLASSESAEEASERRLLALRFVQVSLETLGGQPGTAWAGEGCLEGLGSVSAHFGLVQ